MEINGVSSNIFARVEELTTSPQTDAAQAAGDSSAAEKSVFSELDSVSSGFDAVKDLVSNSTQSGRADYVAKLKEMVSSGNYEIGSGQIADAMMADGTLDALLI